MSKTHLVYSCCHAKPEVNNDRAVLLGKLIYDIKPDMVIDLGDKWEMNSLSSYDTRYPQKVVMKSYEADVEAGKDFNEKVKWQFVKNKVKQPTWIGLSGNHEQRQQKYLDENPHLNGDKYGVSYKHLELNRWYDEYHFYENGGPALREYDGVTYGHYLSSGNYGRAMSGDYQALNMLKKRSSSVTVGHSHLFNYHVKMDSWPYPTHGLVAGCFKGDKELWAGQSNNSWSYGVAVKRHLENGHYDLEWVSLRALQKEYSV